MKINDFFFKFNLLNFGRGLLPAALDKETQDRDFNSGFANGPNLPFQNSQLPGSQRAIVFALLLGQDCLEDQMR